MKIALASALVVTTIITGAAPAFADDHESSYKYLYQIKQLQLARAAASNGRVDAALTAQQVTNTLALAKSGGKLNIITFDAPDAGAVPGSFQGTVAACYFTDCSVLINIWGEITGSYEDAQSNFHGFVRRPDGKFISFDAPGADSSSGSGNGTFPNGISDSGVITGSYSDASGTQHAFLRSPEGGFTTFDAFVGGDSYTNAVAVNLEGAVVGYSSDPSGVDHAFLRRPNGSITTWIGPGGCNTNPTTGCFGTAAFGINVFGTVAGAYMDASGNFVSHGLLRSPQGKFTPFNVPAAGTGSYQGTGCPGCSEPINAFGAVAGYYVDANDVVHGFLRSPWGTFQTFEPPGVGPNGINCYSDCSVGLNAWGAITGFYLDANNVYHGFLRSPEGKAISFDAPGADLTPGDYNGTFPVSINDWGAITGYYIDPMGIFHGFLVLP